MFRRTINRLSLTLAAGLALTACETGDDYEQPTDEALETALSELEAESAAEAMRRNGLPEDAGDDEARPERPERPMPPEGEEGEAGEGPAPGIDPAAFCAEHLEDFVARCETRLAEAEAVPEDFPGCEIVAEEACLRHAARAIRRRVAACHEACRPEARAVFEMCAEDGGEPAACREEAVGVAEACHEACPDARPERPEGERPEGERPERPAPEDGAERPERPAPEDGEAGDRPQRPAPEDEADGEEG